MGEMAEYYYWQGLMEELDMEFDYDDNGRAGWHRRRLVLPPLKQAPEFRRLEKDKEKLFGLRRKP